VLKLVKANNGVIMVNFYSGFVVPEGARAMKTGIEEYRRLKELHKDKKDFEEAWGAFKKQNPYPAGSVHHVVDHIEHIIKVAGVDHVGLGADYDGVDRVPSQLEDVSCYPYVTQELLNRGHKAEAIRKVLGANALRALREAENVSKAMKKESGAPEAKGT
jgi:membrane dipeptidase